MHPSAIADGGIRFRANAKTGMTDARSTTL